MNEKSILKRADSVTFELVAGEAILIDMNSGTYFSLNEVGTLFWEKLDGAQTIAQLAKLITDIYNEKAVQFIAEMKRLSQTEDENHLTAATKELAERYDVEEAEIKGHIQALKRGDKGETIDQIQETYFIPLEMVVEDLLEIAGTMLADNLVIQLD